MGDARQNIEWMGGFEVNAGSDKARMRGQAWTDPPMPLMFGVTKSAGKWRVSGLERVACSEVMPTPPPAQTATLSDRLRTSPAYLRSFDALFAGQPVADRWLARLRKDGGSVESPGRECDVGGRPYEYYEACQPHNCNANRIHVFFEPNGRKAWAHYINRDKGTSWLLGTPDRALQSAFAVAERRMGSGLPACSAASPSAARSGVQGVQ
jgi:hypothetical protein